MTLGPCLNWGGVVGIIMIVLGFYLWFMLSAFLSPLPCSPVRLGDVQLTGVAIAILVLMEGTSAMVSRSRIYERGNSC